MKPIVSAAQLKAAGNDPTYHLVCERCGCCSATREDCWECGGEGGYDLYDDDPLYYASHDWEWCLECDGTGGYWACLGGCDDQGQHSSESGSAEQPRPAIVAERGDDDMLELESAG